MINKTKLLVIADLPRKDRSSAGFRFYNLAKILSRTCEVYFCALDSYDPILSKDHQTERYKQDVERFGVSVKMGGLVESLLSEKYDAIFFEYYFVAERYLEIAKNLQPHARLFIDTVDVHFSRLLRKAELTQKADDYDEANKTKKKEIAIYEKADVIITVTEEDKRVLLNENKEFCIEIIPNIHNIATPLRQSSKINNDLVFVGTFNHEPNVDGLLYFMKDIWPYLIKKIRGIKIWIVGNNPTKEIQDLASDRIEVTGYVEDTLPYLQNSYISIAPLRFGAGMKGKIGEAMAAGLPVITTSIGVEGMKLTHGQNVLVADTPEDFVNCIISLNENEELYSQIAGNGQEFIRSKYSEEAVTGIIKRIFSDVTKYSIVHKNSWQSVFLRWKYKVKTFFEKNISWRFKKNVRDNI
jgi:glycosyltransferase involved in cell wall biosynthesis